MKLVELDQNQNQNTVSKNQFCDIIVQMMPAGSFKASKSNLPHGFPFVEI